MKKKAPAKLQPSVEVRSIEELIQDDANLNRGTKRGLELLEKSVEEYGLGRSVLIDRFGKLIAGNKTAAAAREKGFRDVIVVKTDGKTLVAVQREDLDMGTDIAARELAIADNRVGVVDFDPDPEVLATLKAQGVGVEKFFFTDELDKLLGEKTAEGGTKTVKFQAEEHTCPKCGHRF